MVSRRWPKAQKYRTVCSSLVEECFSGAEETKNWELIIYSGGGTTPSFSRVLKTKNIKLDQHKSNNKMLVIACIL